MGDFNTEAQRRGERMGMGFLDRIYRIWGGRVPSAGVGVSRLSRPSRARGYE